MINAAAQALRHLESAEYEAALENFNQALNNDLDCPDLFVGKAIALAGLNQATQAIETLRHLLSLKPDHLQARNLLENLERASHSRLGAESLPSQDPMEVLNCAVQCTKSGDYSRALMLFECLIQHIPDWPELHYGRAVSMLGLGRIDETRSVLEDCFKLDPQHPMSRRLEVEVQAAQDRRRLAPDDRFRTPGQRERLALSDCLDRFPDRIQVSDIPGIDPGPKIPKMYVLNDFYLVGKHGLVVTPEGIPIKEQSNGAYAFEYHLNLTDLYIKHMPQLLTCANKLPGTYVSLIGPWAYNFFHWFVEVLPRVIFAERMGFTGLYIIPTEAVFPEQSLLLMGISPERLIKSTPGVLQVETLYWPTLINLWNALGISSVYSEIRTRLIDAMYGGRLKDDISRIYISRGPVESNRARVVGNEEELLEILKPYGFKRCMMEKLSLKEQLELSLNADALVGPHGAGNLHAMFMRPQSLVIELFSPAYVDYGPASMASLMEHRYFMFTQSIVRRQSPDEKVITAPLHLIEMAVRRELGNGQNQNTPSMTSSASAGADSAAQLARQLLMS